MATRPPKKPENGVEPPESVLDEERNFLANIGRRVKDRRKQAGLTLKQFGEIANLAPSYVFILEKDGANLSLRALKKLADNLNVPARDLLPEGTEEPVSGAQVFHLGAALTKTLAVLERQHALLKRQHAELDREIADQSIMLEELRGFKKLLQTLKGMQGGEEEG